VEDTIVALATALGEAGIHVIRVSGNKATAIMDRCFSPNLPARWASSQNYSLHHGWFHEGEKILDEVLVGRMLAPHSYTGEDVYEVNCHGGPLIAQRIIGACLDKGARLAEPGEYTKRAFLNGKLDLIQAEAIIDLITARTDAASDLALSQLAGGLSEQITELRELVLEALAFIEASIDFPEDDVESLDREGLLEMLERAAHKAAVLLEGSRTGKILREGLTTVIVGRPNVGKSSLLNALVQEDRAIVTNVPGTTRDEIREAVNIGGVMLQLIDTAGIRESTDLIERLGIERTWKNLETADLILLVVDSNLPLSSEEKNIIDQYEERVIVLANKTDLSLGNSREYTTEPGVWIPFSVIKHKGFNELEEEIMRRVFHGKLIVSTDPLLSNVRQIAALTRSQESLGSAISSLNQGGLWDIISIDVRQALQDVSEITGDNVQESLLDDIFSRFCIGK